MGHWGVEHWGAGSHSNSGLPPYMGQGRRHPQHPVLPTGVQKGPAVCHPASPDNSRFNKKGAHRVMRAPGFQRPQEKKAADDRTPIRR
ncbi:hypothetical protein CHELA40_11692 [Chelatococcus asaccharovorans]|nr:hypothetical protein CHELA40_11692 [Chelatococcus asaccharovorans]CAH1684261.1 hypothetical protein CHELA17_63911 [Chelatococcus asaccharovorans]